MTCARLQRPCDDRIGVSTFRGTVQATSTFSTSFRVVWRGDAFTTPQDAPATTMLAHGWSASRAPGERRQFDPGPVLSQDDGLKVSREAGCTLAAWAKSEFPSVTSSEPYGQEQKHRRQQQATAAITEDTMDGGLGGVSSGAGSLGAVRKGVETMVYACVLEVSHVEKLWVWESAGGERGVGCCGRSGPPRVWRGARAHEGLIDCSVSLGVPGRGLLCVRYGCPIC